jgi:hypothetical protein
MEQQPHFLTESEKSDFERDGFLVLRGVLSPPEVEFYLGVVADLERQFRVEKELEPHATVEIRNAIARDARLLGLLDHPRALGAMLEILGWNIQLTTSHVFVRTPDPDQAENFKAIDWHADGPHPSFPTVGGVWPRMYAKVGYFLTDLSQPGRGNLRVVPGSHRCARKPDLDESGEPRGAVQVLTRPGDAVLFENRTWHAVGPNTAGVSRRNVYIGYCHRYLKAIDFAAQSPELLAQASPIQAQLLGACTDPLSFYLPDRYGSDVPLRELAPKS